MSLLVRRGGAAARAVASPSQRLAVPAIGIGLVVLAALAWVTGFDYLLHRFGLVVPVPLAVVDALHAWVGLAAVAYLGQKIARVGLRARVAGFPRTTPWQRWLSLSMIVLWGGVLATGLLLLVPLPDEVRDDFVNGHLIASVWASAATTLHVFGHRRLARPYLAPRPPRHMRRVWPGLAVAVLPALAFLAVPRAVSPLSQAGAGNRWVTAGPATFLDQMVRSRDGRYLVAGGGALYAHRIGGTAWRRVGPFDSHDIVLGLTVPPAGPAVYVGAVDGAYVAARLQGPYRRLALPATIVHRVVAEPGRPGVVWATSEEGVWRSTDGGARWQREDAGLRQPGTAWALRWFDGRLFVSTGPEVAVWTGSRWAPSSSQYGVVQFDPSPRGLLFASSMGDGVEAFDGRRWSAVDGGLLDHYGAVNGIHEVSVTALPDGTAYGGSMADGVDVSSTGGRSWSSVWPYLGADGVVWRVLPVGRDLVAATDRGILAYRLPPARRPEAWWWAALVGGALACGAVGAWLGSSRPLPDRPPTAGL
ncbi:MAG: hypothetical protein ACRD0L_06015 [Acidimicrobiales bacterium]